MAKIRKITIFDKGKPPIVRELEEKQGIVFLAPEDYPENFFLYKIVNVDGSGLGERVTRQDLWNYLTKADTTSTIIFQISLWKEIKAETIGEDEAREIFGENQADWFLKEKSKVIRTSSILPNTKELFIFSNTELLADENGIIKYQSVFIRTNAKKNRNKGRGGLFSNQTVTLEELVPGTTKSESSQGRVDFIFTKTPIAPKNCKFIDLEFEVMPLFSARGFQVYDKSSTLLSFLGNETLDNLHFDMIQPQLTGTNDFQLELNFGSEIRFRQYFYDQIKSMLKKSTGKNLDLEYFKAPSSPNPNAEGYWFIYKPTTKNEQKGWIVETNYWAYNGDFQTKIQNYIVGIPETEYIGFSIFSTISAGITDEFVKRYKQIDHPNLGAIGDNYRESPANFIDTIEQTKWNYNDGYFIDDYTARLGGLGRRLWMFITPPVPNPKYKGSKSRQMKADFLSNGITIKEVAQDQEFPNQIETIKKPDNKEDWDKENVEHRSYYVLSPLPANQLVNLSNKNNSPQKTNIMYVDHMFWKWKDDIVDKQDFINNHKIKSSALRSPSEAQAIGLPMNVKFRISLAGISDIKSTVLKYIGGGTFFKMTFKQENEQNCVGIDEDGNEVEIPTLELRTISTSQYGTPISAVQEIIFSF